jgi:hypothetical protein
METEKEDWMRMYCKMRQVIRFLVAVFLGKETSPTVS